MIPLPSSLPKCIFTPFTVFCVLDRHRFAADPDPDPIFHFDAHPDSDRHQNNADPHADPTPSFIQVGKLGKIFILYSQC
jgi:hypothetical protein